MNDFSEQIQKLPSLRLTVEAHGLMAKKALGQNFLLDSNITDKIIRTSLERQGLRDFGNGFVWEIGPGPGGLTRSILSACPRQLTVIEMDERCIAVMEEIREKTGTGFLSDSSGHFKINHLKKGKYHITFSFIGFQSCDTVLRIKNSSIDRLNIVLPLYYDKKEVSVKHARKTIKAGRPHLYAYTEDEKNTAFRTFCDKYNVDFIIYNPSLINRKLQGLNIPQEVLIRYNREIFKHLDKTFGKSWRQELPPGIIGMEDRIK